MAATITNSTLSTTYTASEIEDNFADLSNKFGNIDNGDIVASAGISNRQLVSASTEVLVRLQVHQVQLAAGWPDPADSVLAASILPATTGDEPWSLTGLAWACLDTGNGTGGFKLSLVDNLVGEFKEQVLVPYVKIAKAEGSFNRAQVLVGTPIPITNREGAKFLALMSAEGDSATLSTGLGLYPIYLSVSCRLSRKIRST